MSAKLIVAVALLLVSIPGIAQVQPAAGGGKVSLPRNFSVGAGMDYFSGDWGKANINRLGACRLGYLHGLALPRDQCGGPLHDPGRKLGRFQLQALRR
jgi:hypothetical protein